MAAILSVSTQAQGINAYGNTYTESSMVLAASNGFDLFAGSSLSGGTTSPYGLGGSQTGASAYMVFDFIAPEGVSYITETIYADGHGMGTTGATSFASGNALVGIDNVNCEVSLNGGMQSKTCAVPVTPGLVTFELSADMEESSFEPGDSAYQDYWGTFSSTLDYYNANGNLIGQYDFPSPPTSATPEPSSLILFGSGLAGLAGAVRRRLR